MPNNAEDKKSGDKDRKPRLVESAGEEDNTPLELTKKKNAAEDGDVVTSAPKLEDMKLVSDAKRRKELEQQLADYGARSDKESAKEMSAEEKRAADLKAGNEALHKLEVDSIHRDSADFQREKQRQAEEAKEKAELYKDTVAAAGSIEALKNVVDMIGTIETSDGTKMSSSDVKGWIDMAVQFPDSIALKSITRNYGLRDKVTELAKAARIDNMGKRVDAAMQAEDEMKAIDAGWDKIAADHKNARIDAMEKRVDADMSSDAELDAFLKRGKVIDQLHTAGQSTEKNTMREGIGELNTQEYEAAEKAIADMPALDEQLSRYEKALKERGITDIDEAMAKRAIGGFAEKAKGFFGGLFNKKTREINGLMDGYAGIVEARNAAQEAILKRGTKTEDQKELKRIQAERKN